MIRVVDLFAGAGGESTGIIRALNGDRYDLAAVNHWDIAIETHTRNHPQARHFLSDLATLNPHDVVSSRDRVDLLWASPECTHHSIARGGRPRSDQSRASAWLVLKWLSEVYVRGVILENVPEFTGWGPLGSDGHPLKSKRGATFNAFVGALRSLGYQVDWQVLNCANYGDPTTRRRFFLQAVRGRERIRWPEPTHAQAPGLFGERPWIPARDIIDWSIRGESIFSRKRPLAPATLRRIEAGIRRYWGEWAEPFLLMLTHGGRTVPLDSPMPTVTGANRGEIGLIEPFMVPFYGERQGQEPRSHGTGEPVPTIPASGYGKFGLVEPFIMSAGGPECGARPVSYPTGTVLTRDHRALVEPFVIHYYGNGGAEPVRVPLATVTTKDRFGVVNGTAGLDITFRMLQPHELAAAQGFPREYWFAGTKTEQVKQIGNAVPVNTACALATSALGAA